MVQLQRNLEIETSAIHIGEEFIRLKWINPPMCEDFHYTLQVFENINSMATPKISLACCESLFASNVTIQQGRTLFLKLIGKKEGMLCNMGHFFYYTFEGNKISMHITLEEISKFR